MMPWNNRNATVGVATILGLAAFLQAGAALANCTEYAKLSLAQQQENARGKCGFSGPEWNADMKTLLSWCGGVSPPESQAMLKKRNEALDACKAR